MFERYTTRARRAIFFARAEALQRGSGQIDTCDLALGLTRDPHLPECPFRRLHDDAAGWREKFVVGPSKFPMPSAKDIPLSNSSKKTLAYAAMEAELDGRYAIDGEHLLRGLLRIGDATDAFLNEQGWTLAEARTASRVCQRDVSDMKPPKLWWLQHNRRRVGILLALLLALAALLYLHLQDAGLYQ